MRQIPFVINFNFYNINLDAIYTGALSILSIECLNIKTLVMIWSVCLSVCPSNVVTQKLQFYGGTSCPYLVQVRLSRSLWARSLFQMVFFYGIIYHVHYPCLLISFINIMQMI